MIHVSALVFERGHPSHLPTRPAGVVADVQSAGDMQSSCACSVSNTATYRILRIYQGILTLHGEGDQNIRHEVRSTSRHLAFSRTVPPYHGEAG